jgi:hypothetical protein
VQQRKEAQPGKVTVARKIAAIVLAMWEAEERYEPGRLHTSAIG